MASAGRFQGCCQCVELARTSPTENVVNCFCCNDLNEMLQMFRHVYCGCSSFLVEALLTVPGRADLSRLCVSVNAPYSTQTMEL